jgi:hypothetical protein
MRVLLIKTSSMGDVIHSLPAITDAARAIPGLRLDWVVEEGFADLAGRHPRWSGCCPAPCVAGAGTPGAPAAAASGPPSRMPCANASTTP